MTEATVIIPNYNGMRFLPACIASLRRQAGADFDMLVIDNGSTDGSIEWLKTENIPCIEMGKNTGFAAAVNAGIKKAETPYVVLLNNDTEAEPDFIKELLLAIGRSPKLFAVSSLMIKASDHSLCDSAGDGITILGWAYQRGVDEPVIRYQKEREVFSACAGAAIYRRKVFEEIGYFDERHFAYLEDIDISWRAGLAGYRILYCPAARVYHLGSATSGSKYNPFKVKLTSRNNIYIHYKNQGIFQLCINFIPLMLGIILKSFFFYRRGFISAYKEGLFEGITEFPACRRAKAKIFLLSYLKVELMMLYGMAEYTLAYIRRHI